MNNLSVKQKRERNAIISSMNYLMNEAKKNGFPDIYLTIRKTIDLMDVIQKSPNVLIHPSVHNADEKYIIKFLLSFLSADSKIKEELIDLLSE